MERVGILGLGRMGSALARRLAGQGVTVAGWTRSGRSVDGISTAADLAELVAASDVLILSLFDDAAVAEMLDALLEHDLAGRLILETSTVVPQILIDRAEAFAAKGAVVADAPISGGPEMVEAGTCGVFVGGDAAVYERAKTTLTEITPRVLHIGPLGAGMVMKTINNGMIQAYISGLRELLPLAKRAGIPLADALGVLNAGPAGTAVIRDRMPKILGEDTSVGFTPKGMLKDNEVFRRVVHQFGLTAPILEMAEAAYQSAIDAELGDRDGAVTIAQTYHDA